MLRNDGTLASGLISIALAAGGAAAYEIVAGQDGCSGQSLAPGATCSVGFRAAAGVFPGDYAVQLGASTSPAVLSAARSHRVAGPRLVFTDQGQTPTNVSWTSQGTVRRSLVDNVGNAPAPAIGVADLRPAGVSWNFSDQVWNSYFSWASKPTGTRAMAAGERALFDVVLSGGNHLATLRTLVPGANVATAIPVVGGLAQPKIGGAYIGTVSMSWYGMPAANSLNVATKSLTAPTNAAAGPTGTATLTHTGNIPVADLSISFAGANAASYQRNGGSCGAAFSPGGICTVGFRLAAGQFPAIYQDALCATATGLSGADSPTASHEVFCPRLPLALDNGASPTYSVSGGAASSDAQAARVIQYNNVGNRAATHITLAGSGLRRDGNDYRFASGEAAAGRGFVWSIYRTDQLNFALRLDSNSIPIDVGQTPPAADGAAGRRAPAPDAPRLARAPRRPDAAADLHLDA